MDKPNLESYYDACWRFYKGYLPLAQFRIHPAIRTVTDTNTVEHGLECEREIMSHYQYILPWLDTFRCIDNLGMPPLYQFPYVGLFNPTTLRHVITLARICEWQSSINSVCEIGGGYGSLSTLLKLYTPMERYYGYENIRLAEQLWFHCGVQHSIGSEWAMRMYIPNNTFCPPPVDLLISCYALSELDQEEQDWYIDNVLVNAHAGFLVMNSCKNGYPRLEIIQHLEDKLNVKVHCEQEIPLTHKDNYTLMWRQG